MAIRFSWTFSFMLSMAFCIFSNRGWQIYISPPTHTARMGMTMHTMIASSAPSWKARIRAAMTMVDARTIIRRHMTATIWMLVRSLVRRVIREEEEKRSMSAKEKVVILSNWARRRLAPMPWAAKEAALEEYVPVIMAMTASTNMMAPEVRISRISPLGMPSSMMLAIWRGMSSSQTVSMITRRGESTAYRSYPLR